jgi:transcriptional regulator with XRE-family HTH domain
VGLLPCRGNKVLRPKNPRFSDAAVGKNHITTAPVSRRNPRPWDLSGRLTPGPNFAALGALGPRGCRSVRRGPRNSLPLPKGRDHRRQGPLESEGVGFHTHIAYILRTLRTSMERCMTISLEELRRLLTQPPTEDVARVLKAWRAQEGLSQTEAAIRLGVSARTLQGWELGRPMPYPQLLQRAVGIRAHLTDRYGCEVSEFPREFAEFIGFIGGDHIDKAVRKVDRKIGSPEARRLFGDRFYFHEQIVRFTQGPLPFHVDLSDVLAVRTASLIGGINRVRKSLSPSGATRLRAMVLDNLKPDRDIRQIEHEIRCSTHFGRKGFKVTFADLERLGKFDLLVETPSGEVEVECKTIDRDTGSQIKAEITVQLSEIFNAAVSKQAPVNESGLFVMTLKKPSANCIHLARQLKHALQSNTARCFDGTDFSLQFLPRPKWQDLLNSGHVLDLSAQISADPLLGEDDDAHCVTQLRDRIIGLVIRPHKSTTIIERIIDVIKDGADQCTGKKACVVWLHFVGLAEGIFLSLAEFSSQNEGVGLNAVVSKVLLSDASSTDRSHVQCVRFSADPNAISRRPALGPNLIITKGVSVGSKMYVVPNPLCRFPEVADL